MTARHRRLRPVLALGAAVAVLGVGLLTAPGPSTAAPAPDPTPRASAGASGGYAATKTLTRTFVDAQGTSTTVSSWDVTVRADQTEDLRGRQRIRISWSGAQPSGGRAASPYGEKGLNQEYPVVVMQCRGRDDARLPVAQQVRPETCWTSSFDQRSQVTRSEGLALWRADRYAAPAAKVPVTGTAGVEAQECPDFDVPTYSTRLTPFVARSGTRYPACDADSMPPEAAVDSAFPPAEVAAFTDEDGNGSVNFELRSDVENESLGCSDTVACSIVVIPILGLSCQQPAEPPTLDDKACRAFGKFAPGSSNGVGDSIDAAVGPALWWSESNWRHRFSVPVTFGLPPDTCDVLDQRAPTGFYGTELLAQAGLQWSPAYCLSRKRFKFQLNQMSDVAGYRLMENGTAPAAVVSSEQDGRGEDPVGYAPTAVTGFAIGYEVDRPGNAGEYGTLRLTPRLLAKLLTQSYLGSDLGRDHPGMAENPLAIMADPEFQALNTGLSATAVEAGATLLSLSNDSDVIEQLTAYIAQDEAASAFVDGKPDPWGMRVNPAYRRIELPRSEWPLLDTFVPQTENTCRQQNPSVYFTQLAAPVTTMRKISEALLDAWPNVQTKCDYDAATKLYKLGRIDRQAFGSRFVLGVVSLGDAARYGIKTAALQTSKGRFVAPSDASMARAVGLAEQDQRRQPFELDARRLVRDGKAYPGTMIVYTAARLRGLDQDSADKVAQFVRIATTEGQRRGSGNGQLPAGFLPITEKGPTAPLFRSAQVVADAIEAQQPAPVEEQDDPPAAAPPAAGSSPGIVETPVAEEPPASAPAAAAPSATATLGVDEAEPAASPTTTETSGTAGRLLPLLLAAAVVGGLVRAGSRFFVRPPRGLS
ncbi:hypothetical protein [Nocardioides litoris]|uniref:hypothetical protein n=1 Tax=Nocardioides litoris TaxID=1926648 RepID=UPI001120E1AD|nr:hypothetical protein [Nocardioides litoris]